MKIPKGNLGLPLNFLFKNAPQDIFKFWGNFPIFQKPISREPFIVEHKYFGFWLLSRN